MNTAKDHYDQQLASIYSWMSGTPEAAIERNHDLFRQLEIGSSPEVFIVLNGEMTIHFKDGDVIIKDGEMFIIPKGVEHKTSAQHECQAMLVEIAGTINTGDVVGKKTAIDGIWI